MLENSIWHHYLPETTIRSVLASIYGCEASQIASDEGELYAELKRTLTKKELRTFIMKEAGVADTEIMESLGFNEEELAKSLKKSYHKIRNKVRPHLKAADTAE
jgi:hypothetical protein